MAVASLKDNQRALASSNVIGRNRRQHRTAWVIFVKVSSVRRAHEGRGARVARVMRANWRMGEVG